MPTSLGRDPPTHMEKAGLGRGLLLGFELEVSKKTTDAERGGKPQQSGAFMQPHPRPVGSALSGARSRAPIPQLLSLEPEWGPSNLEPPGLGVG